ncbi:MAG: Cd(II)/Pb(II)-responsive transcriptional regulator [Formosimonas sp.]
MQIRQLANALNISTESIRYYEKEGLLTAPARADNGYRIYQQSHLEQLAFIKHCRLLDISMADTGRLLAFTLKPEADCAGINVLIDEQITRVQQHLASLQALEKQLKKLRCQCEANDSVAHCGILQELIAAAHGKIDVP